MDGRGNIDFCVPTDELLASVGGARSKSSSSSQPNIKIATWEEVTTSYSTNDPNDPNGSAYGETTSYTIKTETINYYDMVKQYTMPFDYLWDLMVITEDRGFIFELLRTIYESDIEITVNDKLTDTAVTTVNKYQVTEEVSINGKVYVTWYEPYQGPTSTGSSTSATPKGEWKEASYHNEVTKEYQTTKYVHTITNSVKTELTRANVWIVDYAKNFVYKEEPTTTSTSETEMENQINGMLVQKEDYQGLYEEAKNKIQGVAINKQVDLSRGKPIYNSTKTHTKHDWLETVTTVTHVQEYEEGEKTLREKTGKVLKPEMAKRSKINFIKLEGEVDIFRDVPTDESKTDETGKDTRVETDEEEKDTSAETDITDGDTKESEGKIDEEKNEDEHTGSGGKIDEEKNEGEHTGSGGKIDESKDDDNKGIAENIEDVGNLTTEFVDTFRYKEKNFVTLLLSYQKARTNILNVSSWLFELLEENESTVDMVDLTKYLLYKTTDSDRWGVTYFDFSIFEPGAFSEVEGLCGDTPEEQVWYALRSADYSEEAAAGVLGNIYGESGFRFDAVEGGSGEGIGLCQWSFERKQALINYANSRGKEWKDPEIQITFLLGEIDEAGGADGYATFNMSNYNGCSKKDWTDATTPERAAEAFMWSFERPGVPRLDVRQEAARRYYDKFKGIPLSYFSKSGGSGDFLSTAKECWKKLCRIDCDYVAGPIPAYIPLKSKNQGIQCSGLVDWVLYEMGYKKFKSNPQNAAGFYDGDWKAKYGWEVIDATTKNICSLIKPGDIVVRRYFGPPPCASGHIQIVAEVKGNQYTTYDAGFRSFWSGNSKAEPVSGTWFGCTDLDGYYTNPRIIRVKK